MVRTRRLVHTLIALVALLASPIAGGAAPSLKGRAVWAHPRDAGTTEASVAAFVDQLARAHVNTEYCAHWVPEFVRLAFEEVKAVRPRVEFSAAVFKNPVQSGRFIGQDWRRSTRT